MDFDLKRRLIDAFCFSGAIVILSFLLACDDHGVEANFFKGTVRGELQINEVVPDTTDELRVALVKDFPPNSLQGLITSDVIRASKDTNVTSQRPQFEMSAPLGTYEAAIVIWKAKAQSFQLTDIVGVFGNLEQFELTPIVLTEENPMLENVNIPIDLERVNRTSSISGRITFVNGPWPDNTSVVAIIVLKELADLTTGIPPALTFVPRDSETFDYRLGLAPGTYKFIFVAWLPVGEFSFANVRLLGFFPDPETPELAGVVTLAENEDIAGIDIIADLDAARE
ncbi:MAG: hypothetical protein ACE5IY_21335 [bacterium]